MQYWFPVGMAALAVGVAIWLLGVSAALFPGILALFSFCLVWTTFSFQRWSVAATMKRENPNLLVHRGSTGLLGRDGRYAFRVPQDDIHDFVVCVTNPGVLGGSLKEIEILNGAKKPLGVRWSWQSLYPVLTPRPATAPRSALPAPLLPGGLLVLYPASNDVDLPNNAHFRFTFKMGDYEEKTMERTVRSLG